MPACSTRRRVIVARYSCRPRFCAARPPERGTISFRPRPGSGWSGRGLRLLTMVLTRFMSGRSPCPDNPDEVKGGRRDPVLAFPRLGGSPLPVRAPPPGHHDALGAL